MDQVLECNQDPACLLDALLDKLTIDARKRVAESLLARREIIGRLGTSAAQLSLLQNEQSVGAPAQAL
jgi:hypothetical protein